jgi:hypothetical protein
LDPDPGRPAPESRPAGGWVRVALLLYGGLLGAAVLWDLLAGEPLLYASREAARRGIDPWRDPAVGILAGALAVLVSRRLAEATAWGARSAQALGALLGPLSPGRCWLLALASGVAEEVFFRGALQPRVGLVAASLVFGAAHFAPRRDLWPWTASALAAGFLLGLLFEVTGNLVAPIAAHTAVNGVNLRWLARHHARRAPR